MNKPIEEILNYLQDEQVQKNLGEWHKEFVLSLAGQYKEKGSLSTRQVECLGGVYEKYSPEKMKSAADFKADFKKNKELQQLWKLAVEYYEQNPPYYQDVVREAKSNEDFIPTKNLVDKMTGNNFFKRWHKLRTANAIFKPGDLVKIAGQAPNRTFIERACMNLKKSNPGFDYYKSIYAGGRWYKAKKENHLFLVEKVCDFTFTLSRGSKLYLALDISGDSGTMYLEERMIKEAS